MKRRIRFTNIGNDIFQNGEWYCSANGEHCADVIASALNSMDNEIEELKYTLAVYNGDLKRYMDKYSKLKKENEELKGVEK